MVTNEFKLKLLEGLVESFCLSLKSMALACAHARKYSLFAYQQTYFGLLTLNR